METVMELKASGGDILLRHIANARALPISVVRAAFIRFRVTTLDTGAPSLDVNVRVNPMFDFHWTRIVGYVQPLAAETTVASQHAFFQLRMAAGNFDIFDQVLCMAHLTTSSANGTTPSVSLGGLAGLHFDVPMVLPAGSELTGTFTAETGFGATDKVAEVLLVGVYVHKDLEIKAFEGMSARDIMNMVNLLAGKD